MADPHDSFEALYRAQYRPLVGFFVRRVDDLELARDLTAETFRIAWSRWERGPYDRAWLFGVARNLIGDEYRRRERDRMRADELARLVQRPATDPELAHDVHAVLEGLPAHHRDVLTLTYWDGLTAGEMAVILDIGHSAVWMRLHRARRAFAAAWEAQPAPRPIAPTSTRSQS